MKSKPIACTHNELPERLKEFRANGQFVYAMDCTKHGYDLHVNFGQVEKRKDSPDCRRGTCDTRVAPHEGSNPSLSATHCPSVGLDTPTTQKSEVIAPIPHGIQGPEIRPNLLSIEERLAALRSKLESSGRLIRQPKARMPYADD